MTEPRYSKKASTHERRKSIVRVLASRPNHPHRLTELSACLTSLGIIAPSLHADVEYLIKHGFITEKRANKRKRGIMFELVIPDLADANDVRRWLND